MLLRIRWLAAAACILLPLHVMAQSITVTATDTGATNPLVWGVNAPDRWVGWVSNANFISAINGAGIKLIRVNPIPKCLQDGQDPNPSAGTYNWSYLDSILTTVFDSGAQPIFVVCDFPGAVSHMLNGSNQIVSANWSQYATFMSAVVNRYNVSKVLGITRTIKYWQLWNEPTVEPSGIMGDPPTWPYGGWPTTLYRDFVQAVGAAMKSVDPNIKLIGPTDSWANMDPLGYLGYTAQNLSAQIDILSWNNYGPSSSPLDRMNYTPNAYQTQPTTIASGGGGSFQGPGGKLYGTAITEYNLCSFDFGVPAEFSNEYGSTYTGSAIVNAILGNVGLFCYYASAESGTNVLGLLQNTNFAVKAKAYHVIKLFGAQFSKGDRKLSATGASGTVEVAAAYSSTTGKRYIALVNKDLSASKTVTFTISGVGSSGGSRTVWLVNTTNDATSSTATYSGNSFSYTITARAFAMFEVTPTTGSSVLFTTGFETGDTQPSWLDSVEVSSNVTGYTAGVQPECSPRNVAGDGGGLVAHGGSMAEMFSGTDNSATASYCNYRVFSVSIPVTAATKMSYWILPQQANGRYVAIDYHCTDGSTLRDSGATDYNGFSMHPNTGHGGSIALNAWTQIKCNVGQWLAGKTIDRILINYDRPASTGQYRGYIDDILITNGALP